MANAIAFLVFLGALVVLFSGVRLGIRAVEGVPTVVPDGIVTRGGGWIDGRQASWPFVELHVTPDVIEIRPRGPRYFSPVILRRADVQRIWQPWSPFGRGLRFEGPRVGRRLTFWPARTNAVVEALSQLAWEVEPIGAGRTAAVASSAPRSSGAGTTDESPARALQVPIRFSCSPLWLIQFPVLVAIAGLMIAGGAGPVFLVLFAAIVLVNFARLSYRIDCDGHTLICRFVLWRRRIPLDDILTVQAPRSILASGATVTPRTGWRIWVPATTRPERRRLVQFLDELSKAAPWITVRR